jgi:glycosyltransferase involved in cell wall biosynthesis
LRRRGRSERADARWSPRGASGRADGGRRDGEAGGREPALGNPGGDRGRRQGLLVEPGDARGLADAIARLAADPALRERLGAAARERMLREFDLAANARLLAARFHRQTSDGAEAT